MVWDEFGCKVEAQPHALLGTPRRLSEAILGDDLMKLPERTPMVCKAWFASGPFVSMEPGSIETLSLLHQSSDFLVVNKHWDIRIDSKMWYEKLTVQRQLKHRFPELADPDTYYGFRFCHQLDFSTSGALCVALNKEAAGRAYKCFKERTVTKAYLALGLRSRKSHDHHPGHRQEHAGRTHTHDVRRGTEGCKNSKPCQTDLLVLQRGLYKGDPVTKVLLQPLTGRTHQLRVHCSALGYPIVGDFTYSFKTDTDPYRMMLHAYYLRIPTDRELIEVTAPDPFCPDLDPSWLPADTIRSLSDAMTEIVSKQVESGSKKEVQKPPERPRKEATERERAACEQWLAEWAVPLGDLKLRSSNRLCFTY
ncbi:unnamed protein product [Ranitomeya imitator]|uniref:Pseudouridine synthase RsuA/RluA-like domain-containing protein n=1 Tax=Ranitomeya imitator TaxID=111125 RepID=A0ABN9KM20_9NEOB|nr:unnamed protein product [Ranitomeya imitator]